MKTPSATFKPVCLSLFGHKQWFHRYRVVSLFAAMLVGSQLSAVHAADAALVSTQPTGVTSASAAGQSAAPALTPDGRFVVFMSVAPNIAPGDTNALFDIFHHDRQSQTNVLISRGLNGVGNGESSNPLVSENGQRVVFESRASNFHENDTNAATDIFLKDLTTDTFYWVSAGLDGVAGAGESTLPEMSADGERVVFQSNATNLVANDTSRTYDIYMYTTASNRLDLVSVNTNGLAGGNGDSLNPTINSDGRWVAFESQAANLVTNVDVTGTDIYVRDLETQTTYLASATYNNNQRAVGGSSQPVLSADGRYVFFISTASSLVATPARYDRGTIYRRDILLQTNRLISFVPPSGPTVTYNLLERPAITPDGQFATYRFDNGDIYHWSETGNTNRLVTVTLTGTAAVADSRDPQISPDGRYVTFTSDATNLVEGVTNAKYRLYRRDLQAGITELALPIAGVFGAVFSSNQNVVAFQTDAGDLVDGDFNDASDVFVWDLTQEIPQLVSLADAPSDIQSTAAYAPSGIGSSSADGGRIAFTSASAHQGALDTNGLNDVFVKDLDSAAMTLASAHHEGGVTGDGNSERPILSGDGRYLVFESIATNLVNVPVGNRHPQLYLRDLEAGTSQLVSRGADGLKAGDMPSSAAQISADGRWVVYVSKSTNLVAEGYAGSSTNVLIYDRVNQTNGFVNLNLEGTSVAHLVSASGGSDMPLLTTDGRFVLFRSDARDLVPELTKSFPQKSFLRDLETQTTRLVGPSTNVGNAKVSQHALNAGATRVAIVSQNLSAPTGLRRVSYHDLSAGTETMVCTNCHSVSLNAVGDRMAYVWTNSVSRRRDIFVYDATTGESEIASVGFGEGVHSDAHSSDPLIDASGRYVVFRSKASNLTSVPDANGRTDIFLRDLVANTTLLVTVNREGTAAGNRTVGAVTFSPDGRTLLFESFASDLVGGDYNEARDIFTLTLSSGDSDGDGLEDAWEITHFGDLERDGSGDLDVDGASDAAEFAAGTSPTSEASVFQVMELTSLNTGSVTLLWSAVAGKSYRVQYKDSLEAAAWITISELIQPASDTGSFTEATGSSNRFYRVILAD